MAWERNTSDKNKEKLKIILTEDKTLKHRERQKIEESPIFIELIHFLYDNGFEIVRSNDSKEEVQKQLKDPLVQVLTTSELHSMVEDIYLSRLCGLISPNNPRPHITNSPGHPRQKPFGYDARRYGQAGRSLPK